MKDFELTNINGSMFIELRTDGGIGIYYDLTRESKSVALQLSRHEMLLMASWLISYIEANKEIIVGTKKG